MDNLHALCHFPGHVLDGIRLLYAHQGTPGVGITLNRLWLRDEEHGVAHVSGGELAPMFVECDALAERDGPAFDIGGHLPLLGQFGDIRPRMPVNADEELQGGPFIQVATAGIEPGEVGVPAQGGDGDLQAL